jgi:hypothetical protein
MQFINTAAQFAVISPRSIFNHFQWRHFYTFSKHTLYLSLINSHHTYKRIIFITIGLTILKRWSVLSSRTTVIWMEIKMPKTVYQLSDFGTPERRAVTFVMFVSMQLNSNHLNDFDKTRYDGTKLSFIGCFLCVWFNTFEGHFTSGHVTASTHIFWIFKQILKKLCIIYLHILNQY